MRGEAFIVRDPMHDDFAGTGIRSRPLPADYVWRTDNRLRRLPDCSLHHCIATPLAFLYQKLVWHERLVGRRRSRQSDFRYHEYVEQAEET